MQADYTEEKRLAVVMYGGVSLAIYICGVARELLSLVRATAPARGDFTKAGVNELKGVEEIYRELASRNGVLKTRVTIDIISGTSAGGINGVFLAKALANGLSLDPIIDLWINTGDISLLLNDPTSATPELPAPDEPPTSLLSGEHLYRRLLNAFDSQDDNRDTTIDYEPSRIDLFVTATDFRGEVMPLPHVSNAIVFEKRHRQSFHFTARPEDGATQGEFARKENPLLAFAARCTSSFPAAFDAFCWNDALAVERGRPGASTWTDRLAFTGASYADRPLVDGGVLDNKPFSHALDELARRQSAFSVQRSLIYVEPDPVRFDQTEEDKVQSRKPDAIESAIAALSLPGDETIREDLDRVQERNTRVRQLQRYEGLVEDEIENPPPQFTGPEWKCVTREQLIERYGVGYGAYHHLKVESAIEALVGAISGGAKLARPELDRVLRELADGWLRHLYKEFPKQLELLLDADLEFRLRKFSFVLRRLGGNDDELALRNEEPGQVREARKALKTAADALYAARSRLKATLWKALAPLRENELSDLSLEQVAVPELAQCAERLHALREKTQSAAAAAFKLVFDPLINTHRSNAELVFAALRPLPRALALFERFEFYDMVIYPLVRNGGVDEAVEVKVVRISPLDIAFKDRGPLAGNSLGHFGAFLEEQRRHHDVLCGRLDAAEIIIGQLTENLDLRKQKVREAHERIVEEMLKEYLIRRAVKLGTPLQPEVRAALNDKSRLLDLFLAGDAYDLGLDNARQVESAGRAAIIVEKMLRGWALKNKVAVPKAVRWVVLGLAMLGQIAIPRSLASTVATSWGRLLVVLFGLVSLGGFLSSSRAVTTVGLKGLGLIVALGLVRMFIASAIGDPGARHFSAFLRRVAPWAILAGGGWLLWDTLHVGTATWPTWTKPLERFDVVAVALMLFIASCVTVVRDLRQAGRWVARPFRSRKR